jgi:subtilisin family serine protease
MYREGTEPVAATDRRAERLRFTADRIYRHAARGFTARLSAAQVEALRADPAVAAVVPDERIELTAQQYPTGISRIGTRVSPAANIDGIDKRVGADVAIVDTGIASVAELNVAGGYNCSTSNRALWRDVHGHGTHVAGTVGAIDNTSGVVGVAPGVRLWAVKILDDSGSGLLSWYVCGLDWIAAQRDPADPSRPRFEAVNMSVAKWGSDDRNCGATNDDILHAAICRLVASGVTVVAAAANDSGSAAARVPAAYNEVITVSALADTDGKPGALGGPRCFSWGTYDDDDTFANFSNHGSDVDIIAPGKCIWSTVPNGYLYMSGTSMAAPHVTGAAALLKATRPQLTPAEVKEALQYLGNLDWKITSDPDAFHEKLLDVSRLGPRGSFSLAVGPTVSMPEVGGTATFPVTVSRTATSFERVVLKATGEPSGATASFDKTSLFGFDATSATLSVVVPAGTKEGTYPITVTASEHGLVRTATATLIVQGDPPNAFPPTADPQPGAVVGGSSLPTRVVWPAATDQSPITGYELQSRVDGGGWGSTISSSGTTRIVTASQAFGRTYEYRVRARDVAGNWSDWAVGPTYTSDATQDSSLRVTYRGRWTRQANAAAWGGSTRFATAAGATATLAFKGRAVGVVMPVGPTLGSVRVSFDGVYRSTISLRSSTAGQRLVKYAIGSATAGVHTIGIELVGNGRVDLDAFVTLR